MSVIGILAGMAAFTAQGGGLPPSLPADLPQPRPAVQCAAHMQDRGALRNCLEELEEDALERLDAVLANARAETTEIDADSVGQLNTAAELEASQTAWEAYVDAECERRGGLFLMPGSQAADLVLDCRISFIRERTDELGGF